MRRGDESAQLVSEQTDTAAMLSASLLCLALVEPLGVAEQPHEEIRRSVVRESDLARHTTSTSEALSAIKATRVVGNISRASTNRYQRDALTEWAASLHRTPMTFAQARTHLRQAYLDVLGDRPSTKVLSILLAQWALETRRGRSMWGYNYGGIKANFGGMVLPTRENSGAREQLVKQRFRAYRNAREGAVDYIRTLRDEFPDSFSLLLSEDGDAFAEMLFTEHYYTGNPGAYRRGVTKLAEEYLLLDDHSDD